MLRTFCLAAIGFALTGTPTADATPPFPLLLLGDVVYGSGLDHPITLELRGDGTCLEWVTGLSCTWRRDALSGVITMRYSDGTRSRGVKRPDQPCLDGEILSAREGQGEWSACLAYQ